MSRYRESLRTAGLRPVQLWLPDTRRADFAADCRNQCITVRETKHGRRRRIELGRGDLVALTVRPIGKSHSRPPLALVVQRDEFAAHSSVTILPVTRELRTAGLLRVLIMPDERNVLLTTSQVLIDQAQSVPRQQIRMVIGRLTATSLRDVDRALAIFLGIDSPALPG
jgi:mRNA interferase MazF